MHRVGYLITEGFQIMSLATQAVFEFANIVAGETVYKIQNFSIGGGTVRSSLGMYMDTLPLGAPGLADTWMITGTLTPLTPPGEEVLASVRGFVDAADIDACGQPVIRPRCHRYGLAGDADGRPPGDIAAGEQLIDDALGRRDRNGKAQPLDRRGGIGGGELHGIDADDLPLHIDERAAGIAGVQRCVCLQQCQGAAVKGQVPVDGGDDAVGHRAPQLGAQRVADGDDSVADLQRVGITKFCRGQAVGVDF